MECPENGDDMDVPMNETAHFLHNDNFDILLTGILMGLIACVGLIGNMIMLRALIVYSKLRTDFYIVFCGLSIADTIFIGISVPSYIMDMLATEGVLTNDWCQVSRYMVNAFGFVSAFLIVVLVMLRGKLLTDRDSISRPQPLHLLIVCAVIFVVSLLSSIPILGMYVGEFGLCMVDGTDDEVLSVQETWLINSFSFFIPLVLVVIIYLMTYFLGKHFLSNSYSLREKQRSRLVTAIIVVFAVCQLPYHIIDIYNAYIHDPRWNRELDPCTLFTFQDKIRAIKNYLLCLLMFGKAIRPVLYSNMASDLSLAFDEVVNCTYCHKHDSMAAPAFDNTYSVAGSTCGGAGCAAGSFHATWNDNVNDAFGETKPWESMNGACGSDMNGDCRSTKTWESTHDASGEAETWGIVNEDCCEAKTWENCDEGFSSLSPLASAELLPPCKTLSHSEAADGLGEMDERPRRGYYFYDRAVSTSSSGSATSQIPLIKPDKDDDIEMV